MLVKKLDVLKTIDMCCCNTSIYEITYNLGTKWLVCDKCLEHEEFSSDIKEKVRISSWEYVKIIVYHLSEYVLVLVVKSTKTMSNSARPVIFFWKQGDTDVLAVEVQSGQNPM